MVPNEILKDHQSFYNSLNFTEMMAALSAIVLSLYIHISKWPCQWSTHVKMLHACVLFQSVSRWSCEQKWVQMCWQVNPPEKNESAPWREARRGNTLGKSCDLSPWFIFVVTRSWHNNEVPEGFSLLFYCWMMLRRDFKRSPLHNPLVATDDLQQRYVCGHNSCAR